MTLRGRVVRWCGGAVVPWWVSYPPPLTVSLPRHRPGVKGEAEGEGGDGGEG